MSPKTLYGYEWQLKQIPKALGDSRLSNIRGQDIQRFYRELSDRLSPKTVRHIHSALSCALSKAVEWNLIYRNPCATVELPRLEHREMRSLSVTEASRLLAAARNDKLGVVFAFSLFTGARPAEVFGLKWSDVDLDRATATIQRTLQWRKGGGWYFDKPKTKLSRRTVPLPTGLVQQLREHRACQAEALLKIGVRTELVFASSEGTPLHWQNVIKRHFKKVLQQAGLPASFRLYDLRHSCATLLLQDGLNPKIVSERLDHASIVLTLDTYSHVLPDNAERGSREPPAKVLRLRPLVGCLIRLREICSRLCPREERGSSTSTERRRGVPCGIISHGGKDSHYYRLIEERLWSGWLLS